MVWCVKQVVLLNDKHENLSERPNVILKKKSDVYLVSPDNFKVNSF